MTDNDSASRLVSLAKEADGNVDFLIRKLLKLSKSEGWISHSIYLSRIDAQEQEWEWEKILGLYRSSLGK